MHTQHLTGSQSQCAACGLCFRSVHGFDAHRVGRYPERRCLTAQELHALGYQANAAGHLRIPR
jgi:hypothetical protein